MTNKHFGPCPLTLSKALKVPISLFGNIPFPFPFHAVRDVATVAKVSINTVLANAYSDIWQKNSKELTRVNRSEEISLKKQLSLLKMKMFSVAVAVAVALTFIWIQESSAVPVTEVQDLEEPVGNDKPDAAHEETSLNSRMMPYAREKRSIECRLCCSCCDPISCGICCEFWEVLLETKPQLIF